MKLETGNRVAQLDISGAHTAQELDALLRKLALLRADMDPPVAQQRPGADADTPLLVEDKPGLVIASRQGGGFRLWLRHRGFGWLAYQIDNRTAAGAAAFITARTAGIETIDFVGNEDAAKH